MLSRIICLHLEAFGLEIIHSQWKLQHKDIDSDTVASLQALSPDRDLEVFFKETLVC
jgi:hypothetical protein